MMLLAINFNAEIWKLTRFLTALLQPVIVLVLIIGLVLLLAHFLTMMGTRWGDHRTSSKAMFFSVCMHLLVMGSLVAMIPEYRALTFLTLSGNQEFVPIRITVPENGSLDAQAARESRSGFQNQQPLLGHIPFASQVTATPPITATQSQPQPLSRNSESTFEEPSLTADVPQVIEEIAQAPAAERPMESGATLTGPQAVPETPAESLPTQFRLEDVMVADVPRTSLTFSNSTQAMSLSRPETGIADQPSDELIPDRQSSETMVVTSTENANRTPTDFLTARSSTPAPLGPTPQSLGQQQLKPDLINLQTERTPLSPANSPVMSNVASPLRTRPRANEMSSGLTSVTSPLATTPLTSLSRPNFPSSITEQPQLNRVDNLFQPQQSGDRVPSAYRLRADEERGKAVLKFGGSEETEDAVDRSLKWMAEVQDPAGFWHAGEYSTAQSVTSLDVGDESNEADVGITSLAVLAFLGKLNTVDQGEYSPEVNRALKWIVSQQSTRQWGEGWGSTSGYLGGAASDFEAMYCHAMATFALAEAYAMSRHSSEAQWLKPPLEHAVNFILDTQNVDGGWRYVKGQREGDMSIFGWQLMALKSAQAAGIQIEERRFEMMRHFLRDRRIGASGGLAGYRPREAAGASAAAETLYCRQLLNLTDETHEVEESVKTILANLPKSSTLNYYYWYYGTLALYQHGGPEWEEWNTAVRNMLVSEQQQTGPLAGSWNPHDVWGGYGGRMYSTAIATLSLEVYYRYQHINSESKP